MSPVRVTLNALQSVYFRTAFERKWKNKERLTLGWIQTRDHSFIPVVATSAQKLPTHVIKQLFAKFLALLAWLAPRSTDCGKKSAFEHP